MKSAIVTLCKALGQILAAHYHSFDPETSALMKALSEYVQKYGA